MKKRWFIGTFIGISLVLGACGAASTSDDYDPNEAEAEDVEPDMTGFVMDQDENKILVVTPMGEESTQEGRAMWVSEAPEGRWIGKQVEVWVDGAIAESFPEQATAERVQELEMSEVEGADLKASEALSTALSEADRENILAVELLAFDQQADQWTVRLKEHGTSQGEWKTIVKDEK
jgi:hypothetical protein